MNQIFTAGYSGHSQRSMVLAARQLDAMVIDIRHQPFSKYPGFDRKSLLFALDSRYHHLPQLGNLNHAREGAVIQLADEIAGIRRVVEIASARNVILLCGCKDVHTCHRGVVMKLLAARGVASSELDWPDVPKIDLATLPDIALSIMQPWAWLIVNGYKNVENRTWHDRHRGRFLVHTGKQADVEAYVEFMKDPKWRKIMPKLGDLDKGGIVGVATIWDCVQSSSSEWFFGPYGFTISGATALPFKELRGAQRFFSVQAQLEAMKQTRLKAA